MDRTKGRGSVSKYLWLIFLVIGVVGFLATWFSFPHDRETPSLAQYLILIIIFTIFLLSIGFFPNRFRLRYLLLLVPFIAYLGYLAPRMTYLGLQGQFDIFYTLEFYFLYPGLIMAVCLAYRLGGGSPGRCLKIGLSGILLLFSGFLDLMWFVSNRLDYAKNVGTIPHIQVIIGHVPSLTELVVFILVHFGIIAAINCLPLDKWMKTE